MTSTGLLSARPPLEHGADRIVGVVEAQAEDVAHLPADDALVVETGQLKAAAAADDASSLWQTKNACVRAG